MENEVLRCPVAPHPHSPHRLATDIDPHDLAMTAFASDPRRRARADIVNVDTHMQLSYDSLRTGLIPRLSPVIVVNNDAKGGEYNLVLNGTVETTHPIPETFELAKAVAHVPLGIFSVVAPYLRNADTSDWEQPLLAFSTTLGAAESGLDPAGLPPALRHSCEEILQAGVRFIDRSIEFGTFSVGSFEKFAAKVYPHIRTNMLYASRAQIEGVRGVIKRWKKRIGQEDWAKTYVVVMSMWTTSVLNQNSIILRGLMDPDAVDSHLIDLPSADFPANYLFVALDNLARIVQDNVAAEMIFPTDQVVADALKGTQDLLSETILGLLEEDPAASTAALASTE